MFFVETKRFAQPCEMLFSIFLVREIPRESLLWQGGQRPPCNSVLRIRLHYIYSGYKSLYRGNDNIVVNTCAPVACAVRDYFNIGDSL